MGRRFESCRAHHSLSRHQVGRWFLFLIPPKGSARYASLNPRLDSPRHSPDVLKLETVPKELVVYVVVVLHLRSLHERAQQARTAIGGGLFQIGVASLHVATEKVGGPLCLAEISNGVIDVIRQVAFGLTQVLDLGGFAVQTGFEDRI